MRLPEEGELAEVLLGAAELAAKELRKGAPVRFAGHLGGYSKFQLCRDIVGAEDRAAHDGSHGVAAAYGVAAASSSPRRMPPHPLASWATGARTPRI